VAAGQTVREVPPQLSQRERGRSRPAGKSDPSDALAIARVTLREPDLPPVRVEDRSTELGLLTDARDDVVRAQTQARNRLHAHLVVLLPGYGRTASQLVSRRQLEAIEQALQGVTGSGPSLRGHCSPRSSSSGGDRPNSNGRSRISWPAIPSWASPESGP
jgi:transposase